MHNRALHDTLAAFVEEAAWQLAEEVSGGAEVPFELVTSAPPSRSATPLYCYKPLTGRFIAERIGVLGRLPSYPAAAQGLAALPDLASYLVARGQRVPGPDARSQADATLQTFLTAMWAEATDFTWDAPRFAAAYGELEAAAYGDCSLSVVLARVEGLVIESDEVALGDGLSLVRAVTLQEVPGDLLGDDHATVAVLALESAEEDGRALEGAGRRLRRLQSALRLWDDAEPSLGPTAWARTDGGPWMAVPLATGLRRAQGDCLLAAEEEDPLRAFCSLVARRTPRAGELAWALRRFELGCERASALEALSDWLLAAKALLAQPDAVGYERMVERLAAICATPDEREALDRRLWAAVALERAAISGRVRSQPEVDALIADFGGCVRAVLRDVLCGHLDPDLRRVADELLAESPEPAR
ncbi:MAG: hypothetical protein QOK21_2531 [Solirubrobacteraceae bacterium]|jgi:hypothetical protein|nr:hypothetical protein [Solirubrobacteraceae bacterium]